MADSQEAIKRLTVQSSAPGAEQTAAALRGVAGALEGVTVASNATEKASLSLDQKFAQLERRYISQVRAQQDFEKIQRQVNAAVAQNPALQDRANAILAAAKDRHDQLANSQKALGIITSDLNGRIQAAAGSFGTAGQVISALGPVGVGVAAVIGTLVVAFHAASEGAHMLASKARELKEFSEATGLTVYQVQALRGEATKFGVDSEALQGGLQKFTTGFQELRLGSGELLTQIRRINPELASEMAAATDTAAAFTLFGQAVSQTTNIFERNALVRAGLGRGGLSMGQFAGSVGDVKALGAAAEAAGKGLNAGLIERLKTLDMQIEKTTKKAKENLSSMFAENVLQGELSFAQGMLKISEAIRDFKFSSDFQKLIDFVTNPAVLAGLAAVMAVGAVGAGMTLGGAGLALGAGVLGAGAVVGGVQRYGSSGADSPTRVTVTQGNIVNSPGGTTSQFDVATESKRISLLGDAASASEKLNLKIAQLKLGTDGLTLSTGDYGRAVASLRLDAAIAQQNAYLSALGASAPIAEIVKQKELELQKLRLQDSRITQGVVDAQVEMTRRQQLGTASIDAQTDAEGMRYQAVFKSSEAGTAYAIVQTRINQAIAAGQPLTVGQIAELQKSAEAFAAAKKKADDYSQIFDTLKSGAASFGSDLVSNLRNGESAMAAIGHAAQNLSGQLTNSAITNLLSGNFIGAAVSGIGAVISGIFGNNQKKRDEEEAKAKAAVERMVQYAQRAQSAGLDTSTQSGSLASQEIQFQAERAQEAENGNRALAQLLIAQNAERVALQSQWDAKDLAALEAANTAKAAAEKAAQDAALQRQQTYLDRLFSASNDTSTLGGALAEFERQAMKDRADEIAAGGQSITELIAAQETERYNIYKKFNDASLAEAQAAAAAQKKALLEVQQFVDQVGRTIRAYLDNLQTGASSTLSPQARLNAAQSQFNSQFALAKAGDRNALGTITQYSQTLIDAAKTFYASSDGYSQIFDAVTSKLASIPADLSVSQVTAADQIVAAIQESKAATVSKLQDGTLATIAAGQMNSDVISRSVTTAGGTTVSAVNGAGGATVSAVNFANGQTVAAVYGANGQMVGVTVAQTNAIDATTGAVRATTGAVGATTGAVNATGASNDNLTAAQSALIAAQNALGAQQVAYLQTQNNLLSAINALSDRSVAAMNGVGTVMVNVGNGHTAQFGAMTGLLAAIAYKPAPSNGNFWDWLGFQNGGVIPGYAGGGVVGNGAQGVDSVIARYAGGGSIALAGGEFVMPAQQTKQFYSQLESMRSGGGAGNDNSELFAALARTNAAGFSAVVTELRELRAAVYGGAKIQADAVKQSSVPARPGRKSAA